MGQEDQDSRLSAAARWYAELQSPEAGASTWDAFRAWERGPGNAAAFREIEAALSALDRSSLAAQAQAPVTGGRVRRSAVWWGAAAAAFVVAALGAATWVSGRAPPPSDPPPLVYATSVGEQRVVDLEDGSSVWLNTASRIEVAYAPDARLVRLTTGQALFDVEPGAVPFLVDTAASRTRALGTAFEVYVRPDGAQVTLLDGSVSVAMPGGAAGEAAVLVPGDRLVIADGEVLPVVQVDVAAALSWRTGTLQFTDVRLADAVEELNRYSETRIIVDDPTLAEARLSGAFKAGDQETFVAALALFLPVEAERAGNAIKVVPAGD
ncbi:MAG: FecR family protein [Pannonibacter sp.]